MFFYTDTADAPWTVIKSDCKKRARLNAMRYILHKLPYDKKDIDHVASLDPLLVGRAHVVYEKGREPERTAVMDMTSERSDLTMLRDKLRAFAVERDWEQFHSPKNLSMALMVEVAELMEHFQWLTRHSPPTSRRRRDRRSAKSSPTACSTSSVCPNAWASDLREASLAKLEKNALKYPADQVRGSAKKYSDSGLRFIRCNGGDPFHIFRCHPIENRQAHR